MSGQGKSEKSIGRNFKSHSMGKNLEVKKSYQSPKIFFYGKLRDLTLAPSPGTFESGMGRGFKGFP